MAWTLGIADEQADDEATRLGLRRPQFLIGALMFVPGVVAEIAGVDHAGSATRLLDVVAALVGPFGLWA